MTRPSSEAEAVGTERHFLNAQSQRETCGGLCPLMHSCAFHFQSQVSVLTARFQIFTLKEPSIQATTPCSLNSKGDTAHLGCLLLLLHHGGVDAGVLQVTDEVLRVFRGDHQGQVVTPELLRQLHHIQQLGLPLLHQHVDVLPDEHHLVELILNSYKQNGIEKTHLFINKSTTF